MATFLTKREAKERARIEREQKRTEKLYWSDLFWAAKRRVLTEKEVYDLYKLSPKYSNYGPERLEYELEELMRTQEFLKRHTCSSKDPYLNALQKHLYDHNERLTRENKEASKKIVHAHPDLAKIK